LLQLAYKMLKVRNSDSILLAYQGKKKEIVYRLIVEYSSLRALVCQVNSLVVEVNGDQWRSNEFIGLMNKEWWIAFTRPVKKQWIHWFSEQGLMNCTHIL
jgi:hypothetical protein